MLESANTHQKSGSLRALDASMFCQSDRSLTEVAAFGVSIFLRSRLGGKKFCLCYRHEAMSSTIFSAFDTIRPKFHHYQNQTRTPLHFSSLISQDKDTGREGFP